MGSEHVRLREVRLCDQRFSVLAPLHALRDSQRPCPQRQGSRVVAHVIVHRPEGTRDNARALMVDPEHPLHGGQRLPPELQRTSAPPDTARCPEVRLIQSAPVRRTAASSRSTSSSCRLPPPQRRSRAPAAGAAAQQGGAGAALLHADEAEQAGGVALGGLGLRLRLGVVGRLRPQSYPQPGQT